MIYMSVALLLSNISDGSFDVISVSKESLGVAKLYFEEVNRVRSSCC